MELDVLNKKLKEFRKEFRKPVEEGKLCFYEPGLEKLTEYLYNCPDSYMFVERGIFHRSAHHYEEAKEDFEKALMLEIIKYNEVAETAFEELAPHKICAFIYDLANAFNRFYHETKILTEEDETRQKSYIALLMLARRVLETCIDMLGFEAPERM